MIALAALMLFGQTVLAPGLYSVPACGPTATTTPAPTPTATVASTPTATPTSAIVIGPTPVPPLLLSFSTAIGPDGHVHAGTNQAWNTVVQQGVLAMDLYIDGTFYPNPIAPKHTLTYTISNPNGAFFWAPVEGVHQFVLKFYDGFGALAGTVPEQITVYP